MKRMPYSRRQWHLRHARNLDRRRARRRRQAKQYHQTVWSNSTLIRASEVISIATESDRQNLLQFIADVRALGAEPRPCRLDFRATRRIMADGMILLRAELCEMLRSAPLKHHLRCIPPHNIRAKEVLYQAGIFDLLGQEVAIRPRHPDVVHWRSAHGDRAEGEKSEQVLGSFEGQIARELMSGLFVSISEAMTNTAQHAYIPPADNSDPVIREHCRPDAEKGRGWWMFSQEKDQQLYVVFCDLGIGIPGSLPNTKPRVFRRLLQLGVGNRDSKYIEFAVQDSTSRTGKHYRGKGLGQIAKDLLQYDSKSEIVIFSNRGCCQYRKNQQEPVSYDYKQSIQGTVICWRTRLPQKK